ncbi:MAG: PEP-CTERM sorting domain-containing protein [Rhodospirillaceae bacterium]|jgi:hypothetical protein|nr:PEP-CTERM sorting domain-containing protein [Rhodospirillaceae bacterium]MBT5456392.1 PEP-CTERM sorting domain-containing protein [Rhodospirillaceae bacterium]
MFELKKYGLRALAAAGISAAIMLAGASAQASHWRGGSIAWTPSAVAANTIDFTVTSFWRRSFFGAPNLGDPINLFGSDGTLSFGDGATVNVSANSSVTTVFAANDWIGVTSTATHTYGVAGPFTAIYANNDCCRIGSLQNNAGGAFELHSVVNLGMGSSPNAGSSSPIFLVPDGGIQMFNPFSLSDPDGGPHGFALATATEAGSGFANPLNLSINALTGDISWDTDTTSGGNAQVGDLFSLSMIVTDPTGNTAPLDIILQVCDSQVQGCGGFQGVVSEPGTLAGLGIGLVGLAAIRRRRKMVA